MADHDKKKFTYNIIAVVCVISLVIICGLLVLARFIY